MRSERGPRWLDPWLWVALASGAAVRAIGIGTGALWLDEAISAEIASLSPAEILRQAARDLNPPGYYLLLHYWIRPWPAHPSGLAVETALRSLSAVGSLATVPVLYWLGARWAPSGSSRTVAARWAAWLAALSPYSIALGREARVFALLGLVLAAQWALWTRLRRRGGGPPAWIALTLLLAAGFYLHYHAFLFALALTIAAWAGEARDRRFTLRWLAALAVATAAFLPWLPVVAAQAVSGPRGWLPFGHSPLLMFRTAAGFFRGAGARADELGLWAIPVVLLLALGARRGCRTPAIILAAPIAIAYLASFAVNIYDPRYLAGSAAAAWVLAACAAQTSTLGARARRWTQAGIGLVVLSMIVGIATGSRGPWGKGENWRDLVTQIEGRSTSRSSVLFPFPRPFAPFAYYAGGKDLTLVGGLAPTGDGTMAPVPDLADRLEGVREVWLVTYLAVVYDPEGELGRALQGRGFHRSGEIVVAGVLQAQLFRRPPGADQSSIAPGRQERRGSERARLRRHARPTG
jgi:4-amino-4-deoxy-L-arabinose transferase-like glycosyltransferase